MRTSPYASPSGRTQTALGDDGETTKPEIYPEHCNLTPEEAYLSLSEREPKTHCSAWRPGDVITTICAILRAATSNLVDVQIQFRETYFPQVFRCRFYVMSIALAGGCASQTVFAQAVAGSASSSGAATMSLGGPPPSSVGVFPLSQVHRGLMGTAWTVFEGTTPEPMDVEILGVLRGARGPRKDNHPGAAAWSKA